MSSTDIIMQVRELLGRNLEPYEIAHRLHIDIVYVQEAILSLSK
jgi:hypothetical protein